ncbi:uncharacterized protein LOC129725145 [Wyeomyia smithii]|uniref:uncharacterized protein LOC129725145 n=1 Tax=Wyeomyia smithii TaxID=174621 RepID=UPI002467F47C|nr:uncharacterized protein LOC129725145 [Wyeomyia smithii]
MQVISKPSSSTLPCRKTIVKDDRATKRKTLHTFIRKIIQGPLWTGDQDQPTTEQHISDDNIKQSPQIVADSTDCAATTCSGLTDFTVVKKRVDRIPARMSQLSLNNLTELAIPVQYNSKMARSFANAQNRSPKKQLIRQRNTIAARESRAKLRLMHKMLNKEAEDAQNLNRYLKIQLSAAFSHAGLLVEKLNLPQINFLQLWDRALEEYASHSGNKENIPDEKINLDDE